MENNLTAIKRPNTMLALACEAQQTAKICNVRLFDCFSFYIYIKSYPIRKAAGQKTLPESKEY